MKRKILAAFAAAAMCVTAITFSGCVKLSGNDRSRTQYFEFSTGEDADYFKTGENLYYAQYLRLDRQTGEISVNCYSVPDGERFGDVPYTPYTPPAESEYYEYDGKEYRAPAAPTVLCGDSVPVHGVSVEQDCIPLLSLIEEKYIADQTRVISYYASQTGDFVHGFVNAYRKCVGLFAGGGQIDVGEILYSSFFEYNPQNGQFKELLRLDGCNAVAYTSQKIFYYKNEKYFHCDFTGGGETYICDDIALDKGLTSYSYVQFYFNENYAVIYMRKRPANSKGDVDETVVCDAEGNIILDCVENNPQV